VSNLWLAKLFAQYIIKGMEKYSDVPEVLKPQVKQILIEEGYEHLVTE